jgi:mono/diheme cytochrome c family protein
MAFALSTAHQIGLAATGAAFIIFSLISSFVLPKRKPNFPGSGRNWYLLLSLAFIAAMMSAVVVFGREQKEEAEAKPSGDAAAGKALFASSGCAGCHEFKPAASNGKVGPSLDNLKEAATKAGQPLDKYIETSIKDPSAYITPGFKAGVMPKLPLSGAQVGDLVAFISSGQ